MGIRLQKYLADCGVASRRAAEKLIAQGRVAVDGVTVQTPGTTVTDGNVVTFDGVKVEPVGKKIYIMLNKPAGYITTAKDQFGRKSVYDLISGALGKAGAAAGTDSIQRVFPVGRLDYETSGLILMTNDGDLAYKLTHPSNETPKTYLARVIGMPDKNTLELLVNGIFIEGHRTSPAVVRIIPEASAPGESSVEITIHEGRNRQVRKMFEAAGHPVLRLKRTGIGSLSLGDLKEGSFRNLTIAEITSLKKD